MLPPYTVFSLLRDEFPRVSAAMFETAAEQWNVGVGNRKTKTLNASYRLAFILNEVAKAVKDTASLAGDYDTAQKYFSEQV